MVSGDFSVSPVVKDSTLPNAGSAGLIPVRELRSHMWHSVKVNKWKCGFWTRRTVFRCGSLGNQWAVNNWPSGEAGLSYPHPLAVGLHPPGILTGADERSFCTLSLNSSAAQGFPRVTKGPDVLSIHWIYCKSEEKLYSGLYSFGGSVGKNLRLHLQKCKWPHKQGGRLGYWRGFLYTFKMY